MEIVDVVNDNTQSLACSSDPRGVKRSRSSKILSRSDYHRRRQSISSSTTASTRTTTTPENIPAAESSRDAMPPPQRRHIGDGFDYRRPVSVTSNEHRPTPPTAAVHIDLTGSDDEDETEAQDRPPVFEVGQRPRIPLDNSRVSRQSQRAPRFDHQIFNVDDDGPEQASSPSRHEHVDLPFLTSDPENWVTSRELPRVLSMPRIRPHHRGSTNRNDDFSGMYAMIRRQYAIDLEAQDSNAQTVPSNSEDSHTDEVAFLYERPRQVNDPNANRMNSFFGSQRNWRVPPIVPTMLEYTRTAFDLFAHRLHSSPEVTVTEPQRPQHDPLPPVAHGFTRSPREGDELVCPSCGNELCQEDEGTSENCERDKTARSDNAEASELWMVKGCGHVYCGTCARNRPKSRKGRSLKQQQQQQQQQQAAGATADVISLSSPSLQQQPLTVCKVDGCQEKVTGLKSMVQLFL